MLPMASVCLTTFPSVFVFLYFTRIAIAYAITLGLHVSGDLSMVQN